MSLNPCLNLAVALVRFWKNLVINFHLTSFRELAHFNSKKMIFPDLRNKEKACVCNIMHVRLMRA